VNPLFFLIVAESFVVAWMWHNKSARPQGEHQSDKPDPAVLFFRKRKEHRQSPQGIGRIGKIVESIDPQPARLLK
jgi:hypothetical protein